MILHLIKSEFYKLYKRKGLLFVLLIGLFLGGYLGVSSYHQYNQLGYLANDYADEQGNKLTPIELANYVDQEIHKYAGEVKQDVLLEIQNDYEEKLKIFTSHQIDDLKMKDVYGNAYKDILNGKIKEKDISDYMDKNKSFEYTSDELGFIDIEIFYENEDVLNTVHFIYYDLIYQYNILLDGLELTDMSPLLSSYYQDHFQQNNHYFDSPLSMNLLSISLSHMMVIPLYILVIVFANLFGMEKQYHIEQVIYSTKVTKFKITIAKVITALIVSIGYIMLFLLLGFIISSMLLPIRNFNIINMVMSTSSLNGYAHMYVPFSYMNILVQSVLLILIGTITIMTLVCLLTYFIKNRFIIVVIMFGFLFMGMILKDAQYVNDFIRALLPMNMLSYVEYFIGYINESVSYPYFIFNQVISYRFIVMVLWSIISTLLIGIIFYHSQHKISIY
ncbi:MAG: hypothetical protein K2P09_06095 [Erysipelotrichales bacterium]|nr:hypothetical protein [Erysipelotrichales bacterium]